MPRYHQLILMIVILLNPCLSYGGLGHIDNYSNKLLNILQWNKQYDQDRKNEVEYLLGTVDGDLVVTLNEAEKTILINWLQQMAINQLTKDREFFRNYLRAQYNQFFTTDELAKLIRYFETDVMQLVIQAQVDHKKLTIKEIEDKLVQKKRDGETVIEWFRGSYLNNRYLRFQESITPKMNKMIAERLKIIFASSMNKIPELITHINANQSGSLDLNLPTQ